MKRFCLVLAISLFAILPAAQAQVGIYGEFSSARFDQPGVPWMEGGTFGAYYDGVHFPVVNFGGDLRASFLGSGRTQEKSVLIGPRAVLHLPVIPLHAYAEVLAGGGHIQFSQPFANTNTDSFEYSIVGGADLTFLPRLDWRVFEYAYSSFPGNTAQKMISTGIVFRIPFL